MRHLSLIVVCLTFVIGSLANAGSSDDAGQIPPGKPIENFNVGTHDLGWSLVVVTATDNDLFNKPDVPCWGGSAPDGKAKFLGLTEDTPYFSEILSQIMVASMTSGRLSFVLDGCEPGLFGAPKIVGVRVNSN